MKERNILIIVVVLVIAGIGWWLFDKSTANLTAEITSFDECVAAGFPIMETYPEQCKTTDGTTFTKDIDPADNLENMIQVDLIKDGDTVSSPLTITGKARGQWYFEASFPVEVVDDNGNLLAQTPAQAKGEWMTEDFVPFEVTLNFVASSTNQGKIIFKRDNPSGLPENDAQLEIPVNFTAPAEMASSTSA